MLHGMRPQLHGLGLIPKPRTDLLDGRLLWKCVGSFERQPAPGLAADVAEEEVQPGLILSCNVPLAQLN